MSAQTPALPQRVVSAPAVPSIPPTPAIPVVDSTAGDEPEDANPRAVGQRLARRLSAWLPKPAKSVTLTRNRTRIVSARPEDDGALSIRIHRCFAEADDDVLRAVAELLNRPSPTTRKAALAVIRDHFRRHGEGDIHKPRSLRPRGRFFDLEPMLERVNRQYFEGSLDLAITWGRAGKSRRRKRRGAFSIRLGSYDDKSKLVRIHPVLDRSDVPEYVVESIVHHEMVHAVIPPRQGKDRRSVHPPEFRQLERLYVHHKKAEAWLDAHIERLAKLR